jgi:gastric triacylglycerol lipase
LAQDYLDALRTFQEVCKSKGFLVESYEVTTEDGYILTLFRIPGRVKEKIGKKPVVFLQHGLIDLADTWIMNEPAPAFILSDAGFDIWLGNSRGSFHSLGHKWLDSQKDKEYWEFSWMHMADYDLPSMINFVLSKTSQSRLTYVGHSQGSLQMFAHLSENPSFIQKINIFIALGPVASVKNIEVDFLKKMKEFPIFDILEMNNVYEFLPNMQTNLLFYIVCQKFGEFCDKVIGFYADMQVDEVDNVERFPVILAHETGGTSVMNMKHFQQMVNYENYQVKKFDYGSLENKKKYGSFEPPVYNFTKIQGPVALFSGSLDRLADGKDVQWLRENLDKKTVVFDKELRFGHATFMWGRDLSYLKDVIVLAKKY